ncbi:MAG: ABC transporter substrate-binding protein [Gammaproteobacteria bacterium]|nr:ABC transporter substrate-binding protein [Gammaproteobacteria bacterium]MCP5459601.1 ABC transporter substrate-binding protein [Gammaproteobacteria bacterium]
MSCVNVLAGSACRCLPISPVRPWLSWCVPLVWFLAVWLALGGIRAHAKEVHIIGPQFPPQIDETGEGRIGDIIRATLLKCGYGVRFTIVPFGRHWRDYRDHADYDGLAIVDEGQELPGTPTRVFQHLQNGVVVLSDASAPKIGSLDDLRGHHFVSFLSVNALPESFRPMAEYKYYSLYSDRFDALRLLLSGRMDAIVADGMVMAYSFERLQERVGYGQEPDIDPQATIVFHPILPPTPQRMYFRDRQVAEDFDRCYGELLEQGVIAKLLKPYQAAHRAILADQYPAF